MNSDELRKLIVVQIMKTGIFLLLCLKLQNKVRYFKIRLVFFLLFFQLRCVKKMKPVICQNYVIKIICFERKSAGTNNTDSTMPRYYHCPMTVFHCAHGNFSSGLLSFLKQFCHIGICYRDQLEYHRMKESCAQPSCLSANIYIYFFLQSLSKCRVTQNLQGGY